MNNVFAAGMVVTRTVSGFAGGAMMEGKPIPGGAAAGALAGLWMAELGVPPVLRVENLLATGATFATLIPEAKIADTRLQASLVLSPEGFSLNYKVRIETGSQIATATTTAGWLVRETFSSFLFQSVAPANGLGWLTAPW
jgi:hypothetical protein